MADTFQLSLARNTIRLDAGEIAARRDRWMPISREMAVQVQRWTLVAVVTRSLGFETASWFDPSSPYFLTSQATDYSGLRYFALAGSGFGGGGGGGVGRRPEKPKQEDAEPLESEELVPDDFEPEPAPKPKPVEPSKPKDVPKPVKPIVAGQALAAGALGTIPEVPKQPVLPEIPKTPELPGLPEVPEVPEVEVPALLEGKKPIEVQVVDSQGQPLADAGFTLTLPDGKVVKGRTDIDGKVSLPGNTQDGEFTLELELEPKVISDTASSKSGPGKGTVVAGSSLAGAGGAASSTPVPVEIKVVGPKGKVLPDTEFQIGLPDGTRRKVRTDAQGFIRIPENTTPGEVELVLTDFQE